ncbi:hypothetical protein BSLG_002767 [Batrachochytrium salamandrivorans]|nr:hypothetical protein BSLG_002767 [Batrachochytrium salamandrivorans]
MLNRPSCSTNQSRVGPHRGSPVSGIFTNSEGHECRIQLASTPSSRLAAAQIGHPIQLIAYQILDAQLIKEKGLGGPVPRTFIVNPVMSISDKTSPSKWAAEYEFCESLPKYSGLVRRAGHVHVTGLGLDGSTVNINARGFLARILQHEIDHMEGILFVDRMEKHSLRHDDYVDKFEMFKR